MTTALLAVLGPTVVAVRALAGGSAARAEATAPPADRVSPGVLGFLVTFGLVLATVLLIRSMVGHLRKVRYGPPPPGAVEHPSPPGPDEQEPGPVDGAPGPAAGRTPEAESGPAAEPAPGSAPGPTA